MEIQYRRLWGHVAEAIRICDVAEVFDNSSARHPFRSCATYQLGRLVGTPAWPVWTPSALLASG